MADEPHVLADRIGQLSPAETSHDSGLIPDGCLSMFRKPPDKTSHRTGEKQKAPRHDSPASLVWGRPHVRAGETGSSPLGMRTLMYADKDIYVNRLPACAAGWRTRPSPR